MDDGAACPMRNTKWLVSRDQPGAFSERRLFGDRHCYEDLLQRLGQFPERFGVRIHTYVLMPNHYHLQLEVGSRLSLSAAMHWLNTGYGIWFKRRYRGQGALFQGGSKSAGNSLVSNPQHAVLLLVDKRAGHRNRSIAE
jgi:transposase IS200 family protein